MFDQGQRLAVFDWLKRRFAGAGGGDVAVNFAPRAQQIRSLARKAVANRGHAAIRSEHVILRLLAGCMREARRLLEALDVDAVTIRIDVRRELDPNLDLHDAGGEPGDQG